MEKQFARREPIKSLHEVVTDILEHEREFEGVTPEEIQEEYRYARWLQRRRIAKDFPHVVLDIAYADSLRSIRRAQVKAPEGLEHIVLD